MSVNLSAVPGVLIYCIAKEMCDNLDGALDWLEILGQNAVIFKECFRRNSDGL